MDLLLSGEDFFLVLLQVRRDVALGVLERLLALVVGRDLMGVCVRDLNVVAEYLVEADPQTVNAGPRDFLGLKVGDPFLAPPGNGVQLIETGIVTAADDAALARRQRRVLYQGR